MWRTVASLLLSLAAFGWAIAASAICFFYSSAFWRDTLGRFGAFWGALVAFVVSIYGARLILVVADKLLEPYSGPFDRSIYAASPHDTFYHNWRRYADEIVRNRRLAFYARTRQWDRMSALEAQAALEEAEPDRPAMNPAREQLIPRRTSMAGQVTAEELARASRRGQSAPVAAASADRWRFLEE